MEHRQYKLLIVEDDPTLLGVMADYLGEHGYKVSTAASGAAFREVFDPAVVDLVLLDLALPDEDGLELLRELRGWCSTPLFVVTARAEDRVKLEALELVANDYITKPFNIRELELRIRNQLGRPGGAAVQNGALWAGSWELRPVDLLVACCNGDAVHLTRSEMLLLRSLIQRAGTAVPRDDLLAALAAGGIEGSPESLTVLIGRLRRKLSGIAPDTNSPIETVHGVGYRFSLAAL